MFKKSKNKLKRKSSFSLSEVLVITLVTIVMTCIVSIYCTHYYDIKLESSYKDFKDIIETYKTLSNDYYKEIDKTELLNSAVSGMMTYLNDKYSTLLDESGTSNLSNELDGKYKGIGIQVTKNNDNQVEIMKVYDNTPASKSGLKEKDIITKINETDINEEMTLEEVSSLMSNKKEVDLTILRNNNHLNFNIQIEELNTPVVSSEIYENNNKKIGYISISTFNENSDEQVSESLKKFEKDEIDALIIDVRGNSGGYLNSAESIISMFTKKGKTIYSLENKKTNKIVIDKTKEYTSYPIAVLINGSSASASEILAAALKESYGAILIGTKSFGKGKVQQTTKLSNNESIKYTTALWNTPSGNNIDGVGLTPGIEVEESNEYYANPIKENDTQLNKAIDYLSK